MRIYMLTIYLPVYNRIPIKTLNFYSFDRKRYFGRSNSMLKIYNFFSALIDFIFLLIFTICDYLSCVVQLHRCYTITAIQIYERKLLVCGWVINTTQIIDRLIISNFTEFFVVVVLLFISGIKIYQSFEKGDAAACSYGYLYICRYWGELNKYFFLVYTSH